MSLNRAEIKAKTFYRTLCVQNNIGEYGDNICGNNHQYKLKLVFDCSTFDNFYFCVWPFIHSFLFLHLS